MNTRYRHSWIFGSLLALVGAAGLAFASTAPAAEPGAWQPHKYTFNFIGITPKYSCEGLQDNLTYLLTKAGVRLDGPVIAESCYHGGGVPDTLVSARLKFSSLKPVADENSNDAAATVPGTWRNVLIQPQTSGFVLHGADCELVEEFKDAILPMLAVRNVKSTLHCIPYQSTGNQFSLSFQVFVPAGADHPAD